MEPETKLLLYISSIIVLFIGAILFFSISLAFNPTWTIEFLRKYGMIVVFMMSSVFIGGTAYIVGISKAIRIIWIDHIIGGMRLAGISFKDPVEVSIKIMGQNLPEANITLIPISRMWGTPVLLPISKERASAWSYYVNNANLFFQIVSFYAKKVNIDEFLSRVYGLSPQVNPNDALKLKKLLNKIDPDRIRHFILASPYGSTKDITDILIEAKHPSEALTKLGVLEQIQRRYEFQIWSLTKFIEKILSTVKTQHEEIFEAELKTILNNIRSQTNPISILGILSGVAPDKVMMTPIPQLAETAPSAGEAGEILIRSLEEGASRAGFVLIPKQEASRYQQLEKLLIQNLTSGYTKEKEKKELAKAEGEE